VACVTHSLSGTLRLTIFREVKAGVPLSLLFEPPREIKIESP
jgi:hypothetical protein